MKIIETDRKVPKNKKPQYKDNSRALADILTLHYAGQPSITKIDDKDFVDLCSRWLYTYFSDVPEKLLFSIIKEISTRDSKYSPLTIMQQIVSEITDREGIKTAIVKACVRKHKNLDGIGSIHPMIWNYVTNEMDPEKIKTIAEKVIND